MLNWAEIVPVAGLGPKEQLRHAWESVPCLPYAENKVNNNGSYVDWQLQT